MFSPSFKFVSELGILETVSDEGGYWKRRDIEALAREVGTWNQSVAALVGELKDLSEDASDVSSLITDYPDFEHLEAKGRDPQ